MARRRITYSKGTSKNSSETFSFPIEILIFYLHVECEGEAIIVNPDQEAKKVLQID